MAFSVEAESVAAGVRQRALTVERAGRTVPCWLWSPEDGAAEGRPLVLLGHGAGGHGAQDYVLALARRLVRHRGWWALSVDGPVHGRRREDGVLDGAVLGLEFSQRWAGDPGLTDDMVADWRAALDAATGPDGPTVPVGYWGLSMGTIFGLPLVAAEPRITAAVLGLMGLTGPTRERVAADAPKVTCPVLFLLQLEDELFSRADGLALFDALGSGDKRLHAHPGRHAQVPAEEFSASERFLDRHLTPTA